MIMIAVLLSRFICIELFCFSVMLSRGITITVRTTFTSCTSTSTFQKESLLVFIDHIYCILLW